MSGYLVPERDPVALGDALTKLVAEPGRVSQFGSAGRHIVDIKFELGKLNDNLAEIVRSLVAGNDG